MSDSPDYRVTPSRTFQSTGVDYAGPLQVLHKAGRGQRPYKGYIAVFVCLSTRAIHLELVGDTSAAFLAALRRFTARRSTPSTLYSDNGTNFRGAERELANFFHNLIRNHEIITHLANDGVTWRFIPPAAPHFGAIWEAGIKSVKHNLKRIIGTHLLSTEEFVTLLSQIETCLNSCPIAPLSDDSNDLTSLTSGHFLVGGPLITVLEETLLDLKESRLNRWQRVQRLRNQFWSVWSKDYLHTLQQGRKWQHVQKNLNTGDLVLLRNDALPPSKWELSRITCTYPDAHALVRVVEVRTVSGTYKRPITKLCRLPMESDSNKE